MVFPKKWLSILSVNSLMLFNVSFPVLMWPNIVNGGEVIAQTDKSAEAERLLSQGLELFKQGTAESLRRAVAKFKEALPLLKKTGNLNWEAVILLSIGRVYDSLGEKQKALNYYEQALPIFQQVGNQDGEATTLNNIGIVYKNLGEKQKALNYYQQALTLFEQVDNRRGKAATLTGIGSVYDDLGERQKALSYYQQALPLSQQVGDQDGEATTLNNIGFVYYSLGEKQKALKYYQEALPLSQQVGDRHGEATTLIGIGSVYYSLGEKQKALNYYQQALPLSQEVGDQSREAYTLNNIGTVYHSLGEKQKALKYYQQALPLFQQVGDQSREASTFNNIGGVYHSLGEKQKALKYYQQALPILRQVGDRGGEATTLNNIGGVYHSLGEKQKALNFFNQALPILRQVRDRGVEATTLNNIGYVYNDLGEKQKALNYYQQALPILQQVGDRGGEATTLSNIARLKRNEGNFTESLTFIEKSIEIIEDLRTNIVAQDLRTSYFATVQDKYQFYIDLLMILHKQNPNKGYDVKALNASERSRARSLLDILAESGADIKTGVNPQLLAQEKQLLQKLNTLDQARQLNTPGYNLDELKQQIETLSNQLQQLEVKIKQSSPRYANLKYPDPLTASEIQQQVIDKESILLQYSLGEDRSYLWLVTPTEISSYELPSRAEIEELAKQFREEITSLSPVPETGNKLSEILLSPVANKLENKRLLIVGDGILQTIPFAALPLPQNLNQTNYQPLIVNHEIVTLPSASSIAILREQVKGRTPAPKKVAVFADPVFEDNDPRFQTASQTKNETETKDLIAMALTRSLEDFLGVSFNRLEGTRQEAEAILALVPDNLEQLSLDFDANRETAINPSLSQYQIVHLATHGLLNETQPELSGLVLSLYDKTGKGKPGFLQLNDIFNLEMPAELVVLSACQTGIGEEIRGEGLVSLTRGFMYAGAKRVVVSLWSVEDNSTAELMKNYYQKMLEIDKNPVEAMRETQLEMLSSDNWKAPYYWAPFVVQGEWK
ncbi:MAG: tetratricopeptide repeat protein [Okeania sp. SIO3B5]|uniref:CHAT domain-containing protein n=1 Tax=Okeania sp. SIO3B5 TaxID=2607811 RepID=UPI0013FF82CF|nr:CHAT domain-containing tetratricopeptide repeat protein [Okeania sp. SIO3B5]NEO54610.1 tetratricopeptide repeat protein [Okeania sp. SIO3B5]